ncbi:MAG: hypothetical protein H7143_00530 [Pseudorhodobacter sp.]|nr:hypothetical protein [Rhizobacter sp.]
MRQTRSKPLWKDLQVWLRLDRGHVPDRSAVARVIDYSLNNAREALTVQLQDGGCR